MQCSRQITSGRLLLDDLKMILQQENVTFSAIYKRRDTKAATQRIAFCQE
jgi:hypothetical protein